MMPGMSGWGVSRKIREDISLAHTRHHHAHRYRRELERVHFTALRRRFLHRPALRLPRARRQSQERAHEATRLAPGLARTEPDEVHGDGGSGHPLLSSEGEDDTVELHDPDMDGSWDDEQPEIVNGADESIMIVQTTVSRAEHTAPQAGARARQPANGQASASVKSKGAKSATGSRPAGQARCSKAPRAKQARQRQRAASAPTPKGKAKSSPRWPAQGQNQDCRQGDPQGQSQDCRQGDPQGQSQTVAKVTPKGKASPSPG